MTANGFTLGKISLHLDVNFRFSELPVTSSDGMRGDTM